MATLNIPITKAGNKKIAVETNDLPENVYLMALEAGLKVLLNLGMSKITTKDLEGEALASAHAAAMTKAEDNLAKAYAGQTKVGRTASAAGDKVPGIVMTEARRLAKEVIKDEIKAAGMKVSHVEASAITAAANELLASAEGPSFIELAKANIAARTAKVSVAGDDAQKAAAAKAKLEALGGIAESPKLKAKAEKAKAESKEARKSNPLSSTQAGKVAPRKQKVPDNQIAH